MSPANSAGSHLEESPDPSPMIRVDLTAAKPEARRIAEFLERDFGDRGVAVALFDNGENWTIQAWFSQSWPKDIRSQVEEALGGDAFGASVALCSIGHKDWVVESQRALAPVEAGRFIVHGSHSRHVISPVRIGIRIDAGQAFGTGHHGTTKGCLLAIQRETRRRRYLNSLDLGTGSGVLAIALAKLLMSPVLATDIDPIAVAISAQNARLNRVGPLFHSVRAAGTGHSTIRGRSPYDLIVANILAGPLMRMAPQIIQALAPRGRIILSGLLPHQRERVVAAYRAQNCHLIGAEVIDGWAVVTMEKA